MEQSGTFKNSKLFPEYQLQIEHSIILMFTENLGYGYIAISYKLRPRLRFQIHQIESRFLQYIRGFDVPAFFPGLCKS